MGWILHSTEHSGPDPAMHLGLGSDPIQINGKTLTDLNGAGSCLQAHDKTLSTRVVPPKSSAHS